jgi:phage gp29-like protein
VLDTLVVWWLAATYGPQWLMQFAERFGIPFIYANYPAGSAADRNAVAAALRNLSGKSWGAFPSGTTLQAVDAGKSAGELPQVALIEMADRICTEVIAGGSLTTETAGHGSQALGKVHEGQGNRRHSAILRSVCEVFNAQVIPAILRLNFGDDKFQPSLTHGGEQREDLNATADLLAKAKGLGLAVPAAYAYEVLGIPMPGDDEATLDGPASAAEEDDEEDPAEEPAPGPEAAAAQAAAAALPEAFAADMTAVLAQALTFAAARGAESAGLAQREADAAPAPKKRRATRNPNTPASA